MKSLQYTTLLCIFCLFLSKAHAQIGISTDNSTPHSSAMLDVKSTDKGVLVPRLTQAQRNAITLPATGLMIFQTDNSEGFYYYNGTAWERVGSTPTGSVITSETENDPNLTNAGYTMIGRTSQSFENYGFITIDSWMNTNISSLSARYAHSCVWTGTVMIIWGGSGNNNGELYDPVTDAWSSVTTTNAPSARNSHTSIWTGAEMIVWGGTVFSANNTGGKYNPVTNTWITTSTISAPSARYTHCALWTGTEMIVWGGYSGSTYLNTGGRYNPTTDTWIATSTISAPAARSIGKNSIVWTGTEMIVWGGIIGGTYLNTGGRYNPTTDTWSAITTVNAPTARTGHTAIWTGIEMIIWSGTNGSYLNTGCKYNPTTNTWVAINTASAPTARTGHTAIWTGTEMIIWGGYNGLYLNTGGKYNPNTDSWTATTTTNPPTDRKDHTAIWTGTEMIIWGGYNGSDLNHSAKWNPSVTVMGYTSATKTLYHYKKN